jgi:hypothetical protein
MNRVIDVDGKLYQWFANDTTITRDDVATYILEETAIFKHQPADAKCLGVEMFQNLPSYKVKLLFNAESEILEAAGAIVRE